MNFYNQFKNEIKKYDVWLFLLFMIVSGSIITPLFSDPVNIENLLRQATIIGIMTIGQFLVLITAGFDLSVGSVLALSSIITARFTSDNTYTGLAYALLASSLVGFFNGYVIVKWKISPFIVTIATMGIARGLAYMVGEAAILLDNDLILNLDQITIGFIPFPSVIWLVIILLMYIFVRIFPLGIHMYAVGGRETTARLAGVRVDRVKYTVYTISGFLAGVAGILFVSRTGTGMPHIGGGWELDTIASAVIGGTNMFGGEGNLFKAMAGVIIYMMIRNLMNLVGLDPFVQDMMKGVVILVAVAWRVTQSRNN